MSDTPLRGPALLVAAVNQCVEHPDQHDQSAWERVTLCRTTHCFGGWGIVLAGDEVPLDGEEAFEDAMALFELSEGEACWLFRCKRSLPEIHAFARAVIGGIDRTGEWWRTLEPSKEPLEVL